MNNASVAIIGAGPAGYAAMWAALQRGHFVTLLDAAGEWPKPTARSAGVFVLHDPMDLPLRSVTLKVSSFGGDKEAYRQKVYGETSQLVETSFPLCPVGKSVVYDAGQALEFIHEIATTSGVRYQQFKVTKMADIGDIGRHYDAVISTVPLINLQLGCLAVPAWVHSAEAPADEAYIMYNAHPGAAWYRASAAFGRFAMEYSTSQPGMRRVPKVIRRTSPLPEFPRTLFAGRFGAWDKHEQTHDVWSRTHEFLGRVGIGG